MKAAFYAGGAICLLCASIASGHEPTVGKNYFVYGFPSQVIDTHGVPFALEQSAVTQAKYADLKRAIPGKIKVVLQGREGRPAKYEFVVLKKHSKNNAWGSGVYEDYVECEVRSLATKRVVGKWFVKSEWFRGGFLVNPIELSQDRARERNQVADAAKRKANADQAAELVMQALKAIAEGAVNRAVEGKEYSKELPRLD